MIVVARRQPGSDGGEYFSSLLKEDAVTYGFDWITQAGKATLPNDLEEINVFANASKMSEGWVSLDYVFKNFKSCQENIKKNKSANL